MLTRVDVSGYCVSKESRCSTYKRSVDLNSMDLRTSFAP